MGVTLYNPSMLRFLRLLLAALLVLAVPIQGLAGVTMASCSGARAHVVGHDHAMMGHGATADAGHAAAMEHGPHGAAPSPAEDSREGHNCAACAACCNLSAAPVPAFAEASGERPPSQPIPFFGTTHPSVQARGLERPPSIAFPG